MTTFKVVETGQIVELKFIDPTNGIDWFNDAIELGDMNGDTIFKSEVHDHYFIQQKELANVIKYLKDYYTDNYDDTNRPPEDEQSYLVINEIDKGDGKPLEVYAIGEGGTGDCDERDGFDSTYEVLDPDSDYANDSPHVETQTFDELVENGDILWLDIETMRFR